MRIKFVLAAIAFLGCLSSYGQSAPASSPVATPQFEVASVKMVDPHPVEDLVKGIGVFSMSSFPTNRFFAHNSSLLMLVAIAYDVDEQYIESDPNWSETQLYDIDATVEGERQLTYDEIKPLLQTLLAVRFHLTLHRVTKPVSGFALVIAKGGPKLQAAADATPGTYAQIMPNGLRAKHINVASFAGILSHPVGQPVVDKTDLSGFYDVMLSYAPRNDPTSALPDLFTAVQEQLGLKLQPEKVPVEYLVIDHVERTPTEN
jgi:uncharacterized protein (TIGR03435 family)